MKNTTIMDAIGEDEILLARMLILQNKIQASNDIHAIREGFVKFVELIDAVIAKEKRVDL